MNSITQDDRWLGRLERFPTVLHARAFLRFDSKTINLQKAFIRGLRALAKDSMKVQVSLANYHGYMDAEAKFNIGIGNETAFELLDADEEERVLQRIEREGALETLDIAVNIHYNVKGRTRHSVRGDRYIVRMLFQPERLELLLHYWKGLKRIPPDRLIRLLIESANTALRRERYPELELQNLTTT